MDRHWEGKIIKRGERKVEKETKGETCIHWDEMICREGKRKGKGKGKEEKRGTARGAEGLVKEDEGRSSHRKGSRRAGCDRKPGVYTAARELL